MVPTPDKLLDYTALYWPFHCSFALVNDGKGTPPQGLLKRFLATGEPNNCFTTCLKIWAVALQRLHPYEAHLLEHRLNASLCPSKSPMFTACAWDFHEVAQTALSGAINLDERNCDGDTALAVAAEFDNIEIVKLLL